jgi:predicted RNase H-like HicB family nuclease
MPAKSTRPVKKRRSESGALDRPFDREIWRRAREIASGYSLVLEPEAEVGYVGSALELPNVFADGKTPDTCVKETLNALTGVVARMLELGKTPPAPAKDAEQRDVQLNIRVSAREKMLIEKAAKAHGFRGVSDYLRTVAVGERA